ncbi:hypothetical protein KVV02_004713 [Mortierella alpina]|uniref:Uncharacterized protein n=1 Tax=Mortierella alpina TaxID=64518 RepID=A0A9P8CZ31_MORAP|nr:hypothetical protein KVV02_004713 [Mortierella alpina]
MELQEEVAEGVTEESNIGGYNFYALYTVYCIYLAQPNPGTVTHCWYLGDPDNMTHTSRASTPPSQGHTSASPQAHSSHLEGKPGMHQFEHMAGAYSGVIVVDPNMLPPGYVLSQVATPRAEEPEEPLYVNAKQVSLSALSASR